MIINEKSDKLKRTPKDAWNFDFPFRTERIIHSPLPLVPMREREENNKLYTTEESDCTDGTSPSRKMTVTPPSNPTTPTPTSGPTAKHNYSDPTVYYVSRDFFAATTEHLSVFIDDELELIEELAGGAWTRVRERDSQQIGLIPTEILESGTERLAKENKTLNQDSIRALSCQPPSSSSSKPTERKSKKKVSFTEEVPEIIHYPPDYTNEHSIFPFTLDEETEISNNLNDDDLTDELEKLSLEKSPKGFFKNLFKKKEESSQQSSQLLPDLNDFEKYPDHLIRVYTGNFDQILNGYKTFLVDESLTFDEFSQMVVSTFDLESDGFFYELNLVNHLTAEVLPLDIDFTIEQVIELTKREGLAFATRMPQQLRKAQKGALKRLKTNQHTGNRDKASDYVTPFKFILNRIYSASENAPIFVHVSLAYNLTDNFAPDSTTNLIITSLFPSETSDTETEKKQRNKKKWYHKLKRSKINNKNAAITSYQTLHRLLVNTQDPLHTLISNLLSILNVPETLPGIAFEASLPAIHDAIELPLPINMPLGEVMKIRPKLDKSQQVIIIRPVLI